MMRPLIVANWKMHKMIEDGCGLAGEIAQRALDASPLSCDLVVCPPTILLSAIAPFLTGSPVALGGQDCHADSQGAYTGDVSAMMLADAGAAFVILGHSERRAGHGETDADIQARMRAAFAAGLTPILCVGEDEETRQSGGAQDFVTSQLRACLPVDCLPGSGNGGRHCAIAYEPVWAIGSGRVPHRAEIEAIHASLHKTLIDMMAVSDCDGEKESGSRSEDAGGDTHQSRDQNLPVLYGGSVKPENAASLLAMRGVDGLLVGGASLAIEPFWSIIDATTMMSSPAKT